MKNNTFKVSTLSVLCALCTGLTTNAMAAGTVRSLGGAGTYDGTAAASSTVTRAAPTRAGSLRITPSTARLVTPSETSASTGTTSTRTNTSGQRLSIGKYLGTAVTTPATNTGANAPVSTGVVEDLIDGVRTQVDSLSDAQDALAGRISSLEDDAPKFAAPDDDDPDAIVKIDVDNEVYIDIALLKNALVASGVATSPDIVIDYDKTSHELKWVDPTKDPEEEGASGLILDVDNFATLTQYNTLKSRVDEITGEGGVGDKQPKSTAAYQIGAAGGTWATLEADQIAALNSGVTSERLETIEGNIGNMQNMPATINNHAVSNIVSAIAQLDTKLTSVATSSASSEGMTDATNRIAALEAKVGDDESTIAQRISSAVSGLASETYADTKASAAEANAKDYTDTQLTNYQVKIAKPTDCGDSHTCVLTAKDNTAGDGVVLEWIDITYPL